MWIQPAPKTFWHHVQNLFQAPRFIRWMKQKTNRSKVDRTASSSPAGLKSKVQSPNSVFSEVASPVALAFGLGLWTLDIGLRTWTLSSIRLKSISLPGDGQ